MADDTRNRVLQAAGPIFAERGFDGATVREICDAASVNLASVNYYFGDKRTLYRETVKLAHQLRLRQVPLPSLESDTALRENLRRFVGAMLDRMIGPTGQPWQSRLMMREVLQPTEACRPMVEEYFRPQLEMLEGIIRVALPEAASHVVRRHAFSVIGQCLFYRVSQEVVAMITPQPEAAHYCIESLTEHITEFTLAAVASAADDDGPATPKPAARSY